MTSARRTSARCEGILEQVFDLPILNDDLTLSHEHEYHLQHQRAESEDQFTSGQKQFFRYTYSKHTKDPKITPGKVDVQAGEG